MFGPDIPELGGPFFIDTLLSFNSTTDASGQAVMEVCALGEIGAL